MARYTYIDTNGREKSVEAPDVQTARTLAINIAPTSSLSVDATARANTNPILREGVDLSLIGNVSSIVPSPTLATNATGASPSFVSPASLTVVSYRDNPDGTTTHFLSDGSQETGRIVVGRDGQGTFTPLTNSQAGLSRLGGDITAVRAEIKAIEDRMAGRSAVRSSALEGAGVFEDMRRLNELNASLREAQDRQIEVPIEQRQNLRGRNATFTEFEQATRPELEAAALKELTTSRQSSRLTDAINTNILAIDTKLKAEAAVEDAVYTKKQDYLKSLETSYQNILTEEQKIELEDRKFQNEITRDALTAERNAKQKQLEIAAEKGATPAELNRLMSGGVNDVYSFNANKALQTGDQAENIAVQQSAVDIVGLIDEILANETGLKSSVDSTAISRTRAGNVPILGLIAGPISAALEGLTGVAPLGNKIADFRGSASKLVADAVLQNLIAVKAKGASFGALSESELAMLERAATELRPVKDGNGSYTGQFAVSEDRFKQILDVMQTATMKTYIASRVGQAAYKQAGYVNSSDADVRKAYQTLIETQPSEQNSQTNFYQQDLSPTLDVIRREEGFRTDAYQDSTGKWTIGYGNTDINGRPVQRGDKISREEGERLLRDSVVSRYSTGVQALGTEIAPNKQAALVSFEYNLGPGVWATSTGQRILSLVAGGNYSQAGQLMQQYNKSRNPSTGLLEVNPSLVSRRAREAALLLG